MRSSGERSLASVRERFHGKNSQRVFRPITKLGFLSRPNPFSFERARRFVATPTISQSTPNPLTSANCQPIFISTTKSSSTRCQPLSITTCLLPTTTFSLSITSFSSSTTSKETQRFLTATPNRGSYCYMLRLHILTCLNRIIFI